MPATHWRGVGARFWLIGATQVRGLKPDAHFEKALWRCDNPNGGMASDLECKWQGSSYKSQGLSDRFVVDFPGAGRILILDPSGREAAVLQLSDDARLMFSGTAQFTSMPDAKAPLAHVRHYFDFVKDAPSKPSTILKVGAGAGPVFCPPAFTAY